MCSVIDSTIRFDTSSGKAGNFKVKATTSNGDLTTRIVSAPLDSVINVDARTSNSRASIDIPTTYEGGFTLSTSNSVPDVHRASDHERDPACPDHSDCRSRRRSLEIYGISEGKASGSVFWDRKNSGRGNVALTTSNRPVALYL